MNACTVTMGDEAEERVDVPSSSSFLTLALILLALTLPTGAIFAQEPVYDGLDVDLDPRTLAGFAFSVRGHAPVGLIGEAFESLREGWGGSAGLTGYFGGRYAGRLRVGFTSFEENIVDVLGVLDDRAWLLDVWGELLWTRTAGRLSLEAGPAIGYARLARPAHAAFLPPGTPGGSVQNGFVAGGSLGATMAVGSRWLVLADGVVSWSSFAAPRWAVAPPPASRTRVPTVAGSFSSSGWPIVGAFQTDDRERPLTEAECPRN